MLSKWAKLLTYLNLTKFGNTKEYLWELEVVQYLQNRWKYEFGLS